MGVPGEPVGVEIGLRFVPQAAVRRQVPGPGFGAGNREFVEDSSKPGYGCPAERPPAPLSNRTLTGFSAFECAQRPFVGRLQLDGVHGQGQAFDAHRFFVDQGRGGLDDRRAEDRCSFRDVELEEVVPAVEGRRVQRVDVGAVGEGEPFAVRAAEVLGEVRAVPAGLLVGPLAGHEGRHVDLVDEGDRREGVGDCRVVVVVFFDLFEEVDRFRVQGLVGGAGLIAFLDAFVGPFLAGGRRRRFGVVDPLLRPFEREPGVENAARIERRLGVVDHRERRDRGQVRRLGGGREELADPAVGDPHHPDFVVQRPMAGGRSSRRRRSRRGPAAARRSRRRRPSSRCRAC